jgi:tetratricopeptide (TPR) repeat protein
MRSLFLGFFILHAGAAIAVESLPLVCDGVARRFSVPVAPQAIAFEVGYAGPWLTRFDEVGQELELLASDSAGFQAIALRPPRLGAFGVSGVRPQSIQIRSTTENAASVKIRCRSIASFGEPADGLAQVERAFLEGDLAELARIASSRNEYGAFALHALATLHSRESRFREAAEAYASARQLWTDVGDSGRAAAAMLGIAENSFKSQHYADAVREAREAQTLLEATGLAYFALRAQVTQASALVELGERRVARGLFDSVLPELESLGEFGEIANVHYNLALLDRRIGNSVGVEQHLLKALAIPSRYLTAMIRGRIALLAMDAQVKSASIAESLKLLHFAEASFSESGQRMWQEVALRRRAHLLAGLGMRSESFAAMIAVFRMSVPGEAPVRVADALLDFGGLTAVDKDFSAAERWQTLAAEIYGVNNQLDDQKWAQLNVFHSRLLKGERVDSIELMALGTNRSWIRRQALFCLTVARAQLAEKRISEALATLASTPCEGFKLGDQIEGVSLRAQALADSGRRREALDVILRNVQSLRQSVVDNSSGALRFLALKQLRRLTAEWVAIASQMLSTVSPEQWWAVAQLSHPYVSDAEVPAIGGRSDYLFSDLVAPPLSGGARAKSDEREFATETLIDRLSRMDEGSVAKAQIVDLAQLQATLPVDGVLMVPMLSEPVSVMLWISRDRAEIRRIPGRHTVVALAESMRAAAESPTESMGKVLLETRTLSDALFSGIHAPAPSHAWVLFHEEIGDTPLPMLTWPGASRPLLEGTTTSWVMTIGRGRQPSDTADTGVHDFTGSSRRLIALSTASSPIDPSPSLSPLFNAEIERSLIRDALPAVVDVVGTMASRDVLTQALQTPGALLHVAAHGDADPGFLGYAGLWLITDNGGSEPGFLSWIDVVDIPLHAGLAVFNACRVGQGKARANGSSQSFAAAISAAGVDHVVAALWPVSDAATVKWVPAFYGALDTKNLGSSAEALRQAQLALRNSRHFRHPFYWASLVHFRHLEVPEVKQVGAR